MGREKIRVDRLLANLGYCTRRSALPFIRRNRVTLGGEVITSHAAQVPQDGAGIAINDKPILDTRPLHIILHKPSGYVCTREKGEHKNVYDLLPADFYQRRPLLNICGRLDRWVTGLVFLTQDGQLQHQVVSPNRKARKRLGKTYIVQTWRALEGNEAEIFKAGTLTLKGEKKPCKPAELEVIDPTKNIVKVTLYEGKYHQIRRMFSAIGNGVPRSIQRVRIGPLQLGDLEVGKWRHLTEDELKELRATVESGGTTSPGVHNAIDKEGSADEEKDEDEDEDNDEEGEEHEEEEDGMAGWADEWRRADDLIIKGKEAAQHGPPSLNKEHEIK